MVRSYKTNLWLNEMLLKAFFRNGYSISNNNKSWELTDLQFLVLTPELAKGFLKFTTHPLYRKQFYELEVSMIKQNASDIAALIGDKPFNLIDILCGDGLKAVEFIKAFNSYTGGTVKIRYCPLNASNYLLDLAVANVKKAKLPNVVAYQPFLSSGDGRSLRFVGKKLRDGEFEKHAVMLTGGALASFEINSYLFELSRDLKKGDSLFIGNGVRVGDRLEGLEKYKSDAFHNWFKHLIYGLGFSDKDVEYDARFGNSRVEMFYKLKKPVSKKLKGKKVKFMPGDELVIAALYKYYAREFDKFCKMYFADSRIVTDESGGYALVMCKK
ncbi:MAG: L-histidine N(alpha)-methyltransferase [Nanoarchaeota archaeon]